MHRITLFKHKFMGNFFFPRWWLCYGSHIILSLFFFCVTHKFILFEYSWNLSLFRLVAILTLTIFIYFQFFSSHLLESKFFIRFLTLTKFLPGCFFWKKKKFISCFFSVARYLLHNNIEHKYYYRIMFLTLFSMCA